VPEWARDQARQQLVADELIEAMRRAYPQQAASPGSILIGVTDEDIYISELDWKFALNFRRRRGRWSSNRSFESCFTMAKPPASIHVFDIVVEHAPRSLVSSRP